MSQPPPAGRRSRRPAPHYRNSAWHAALRHQNEPAPRPMHPSRPHPPPRLPAACPAPNPALPAERGVCANADRAGRSPGRDAVTSRGEPDRGRHPSHIEVVLDRQRNAVEPTERSPRSAALVRRRGGRQCACDIDMHPGIERHIALDRGQARFGQLDTADLAVRQRMQHAAQRGESQALGEVGHVASVRFEGRMVRDCCARIKPGESTPPRHSREGGNPAP